MADHGVLYKLSTDLRKGGFSEVVMGTRRSDNLPIALKRPRRVPLAAERLRREIEVQSALPHPNIMQILDADSDKRWFVMPRALGNLQDLRGEVDEEELAGLLMGAADALAVAHEREHFHRDLKPENILALTDTKETRSRRWAIADWGLVTRPYSAGSAPLTRAGGLGTDGFTAPEVMADGRSATGASDVYSLGRIAEWYLSGKNPVPGARLLPDGDKRHWRAFVRACTEAETSRRPGLTAFRNLLDEVFTLGPVLPTKRAHDMVSAIVFGQAVAVSEVFRLAADYPQDAEVYLDELARLPPDVLRDWARLDPDGAAEAACCMCEHIAQDGSWQDRDAPYAGTPLSFVHEILLALVGQEKLGLAEDVAHDYFKADAKRGHVAHRMKVCDWLSALDGEAAEVIARLLARSPDIVDYYRPVRPRHPGLASLFAGQSAASTS